MQFFSIFVGVLFSLSSYAIDPGETGGGSICKLREVGTWISFDRLFNNHFYVSEYRPYLYDHIGEIRFIPSRRNHCGSLISDSFEKAYRASVVRLSDDAGVRAYLIRLLTFLKYVQPSLDVDVPPLRIPNFIYTQLENCSEVQTAITTNTRGEITLYQNAVKKIGNIDRLYLVIHELLRVHQLIVMPEMSDGLLVNATTEFVYSFTNGIDTPFTHVLKDELNQVELAIKSSSVSRLKKLRDDYTLKRDRSQLTELLKLELLVGDSSSLGTILNQSDFCQTSI